jgi:hypothetical protein
MISVLGEKRELLVFDFSINEKKEMVTVRLIRKRTSDWEVLK